MHIYTLASGSAGNCTLVRDGGTAVLIDAGISTKRIVAALRGYGVQPGQLSGILITHEHSDHISGLSTFIKHYEIPVFAPRTVANHLSWSIAGVDDYLTILTPGLDYAVGGLSVLPFHTPHDTPESVGYRLTGSACFGFCTDCGHVTDEMLESLRGVDAAVIEANHDLEMLKNGPYPVPLKRRILSDNGHLSNECCGELAKELYKSGARKLVLGHLSRENNIPSLARGSVAKALSSEGIDPEKDVYLGVAPERETLEFSAGEMALC